MIEWVFSGITLSAVLVATFTHTMRNSILALWVAGLGVGAIYLTIGAEFLAIVQWIVSTLLTITFVFFAVMFGEYSLENEQRTQKEYILTFFSILVGIGFSVTVWYGTRHFEQLSLASSSGSTDLNALGKLLIEQNFVALEVLALTLFLVLVGGGVIARFERSDSE